MHIQMPDILYSNQRDLKAEHCVINENYIRSVHVRRKWVFVYEGFLHKEDNKI